MSVKQDKPGRPPKSEREKRSQVVRVRVTIDEEDELHRIALRRGGDLGMFLYHIVRRIIRANRDHAAT
jgi:hypothetical protein